LGSSTVSPCFFNSSSKSTLPNSISLQSSTSLQFDSSKCADSIAILPQQRNTVHQRASKAWGTVLSTTSFSPKTGIHKWAIKLDRCEKGHVFVGVATAQAGMRTYVGGDRFGWGVIGTQALWHHKSKVRGDYGSTFRTGSTIIVSLDTNAGTLSFGLLSQARVRMPLIGFFLWDRTLLLLHMSIEGLPLKDYHWMPNYTLRWGCIKEMIK
jgi:hypothetical protein